MENVQGQFESSLKIKYCHLHNSKKRRHVTIARMVDWELNSAGDYTIWFSLAVCNPEDVFSKKLGRHISTERLIKGKIYEIKAPDYLRPIDSILQYIVDSPELFPSSIRHMAEKELSY